MPCLKRSKPLGTVVGGLGQNYVYHQNNHFPFSFFTVRLEDEFFTIYKFNTALTTEKTTKTTRV